ncbi:MAG: lysine transporter LysE [Fusobacteriaceae bacterium]|nr:lysine transporter LysE [Fusobacteriaceae bacterium]
MMVIFIKGIMTGLILSLPFGPIGIYCMEKTLVEGEKEGYTSALGMVTIDFVYGLVAFLFINILRDDIEKYGPLLAGVVGAFLISVGTKKFFKKTEAAQLKERKGGLIQGYLTTMICAIFNISSILVMIAFYSISDKVLPVSPELNQMIVSNFNFKVESAFTYASGIFLGGAALWFTTTYILYHWRKTINHEMIMKVTKYSGLAIFGFGTTIVFTAVKHFLILKNVLQ